MEPAVRTRRDGIAIGLIAYAAVALFYSLFDLLAARGSLYTVDLLGKAVFRGLRDPMVLQYPIERDTVAIFWYNGFHLVMSLLIGLIVIRLLDHAERHPGQGRAVLFVIVAGFVATVVGIGWLTAPMRPVLPWWSIAVANALATLLAGMYLLNQRPGLWHRLVSPGG